MAQIEPERNTEAGKLLFKNPDLFIVNEQLYPSQLSAPLASDVRADLDRMGLTQEQGALDIRTLRFATLLPSEPVLPGDGVGNNLSWNHFANTPHTVADMEAAAWLAFQNWITDHEDSLGIDISELAQPGRVAVHDDGNLIQIVARRQINGIPVFDSVINAVINHGNLILFGARNWADVNLPLAEGSYISAGEAQTAVNHFLDTTPHYGFKGKSELMIVPIQRGDLGQFAPGNGLDYRLAWSVAPNIPGEIAEYRALVDAHSGEMLAFEDTNHYAAANSHGGNNKGTSSTRVVVGGVYPVSNNGVGAGGTEQPGFPMPFADIEVDGQVLYTDTSGNLTRCVSGTVRSHLSGLYVTMNDTCGAIDETSTGDLDLSQSSGTDCVVPVGHSSGDTHASRTGYYELNRIAEMARAQLPNNPWLQQQLQANMNIINTCNATWNGAQVNFYRSGGGCGNTGEIAAIFDHEWGHGMDDNDIDGFVGFPGEGIADIYSTLRLNESCVGAGFRLSGTCGGYGDTCTSCSGVRDVDWAKHSVGQPWNMDYIFGTGPWAGIGCGGCSGTSHCEGYLISSSVWDLVHRKLVAAPYNLSLNTALEIGTRLTYLGAGPTSTWFECNNASSFNGCAAGSGYMNYLAADDDNGNLNDGTPHMTAIYNAFNDHEVACATPAVSDSGCAGAPSTAPTVNATGQDRGAALSWNSISGATRYKIYRTEGVFQCNFGKVLIADTSDTTYLDLGLANGIEYSYIVIPFGDNDACFGPASSCTSVTPADGPNLSAYFEGTMTTENGDGDIFVDNCETVSVTIGADNIGVGAQTNVRIVSAESTSHPETAILSSFPVALSASLSECEQAVGQISFIPDGLAFGDEFVLSLSVTSDQLAGRTIDTTISIQQTESDVVNVATRTYTFEVNLEGWTVDEGTFTRGAGGANGTSFRMQSSSNLDDQCDRISSPIIVPTASTTLSIWTNYDIEPFSAQWWDRANVGLTSVATGVRETMTPDGGRSYEASGIGGTCYTTGEGGWAGANATWASSTFSTSVVSATGLTGEATRLSIAYGTDSSAVGAGFRFDQVTLTNFQEVVEDTQNAACVAACPSDWAAWPENTVIRLVECLDSIVIPTKVNRQANQTNR